MTLFRNDTHRDVWQMRWCHTCFQPDEAARRLHGKGTVCPIWEKAIHTQRKPPQWDRMPRADTMDRTIRCNEYTDKPPLNRRQVSQTTHDEPLLDVTPYKTDIGYVPVDGWPEKPKKDEVDHQ